ncbi:hypothetical protein CP532_6186 [Ophiocordyceps camponoti-leonardi (nom. inval.)]|nr:hypothetical protein CP532_6186 [Ophiocordyceps camponoti-leonardi (nom. inval.)]
MSLTKQQSNKSTLSPSTGSTLASSNPGTKMKVLSLGLPRTGSASIAKALTILGYENVCHGVDIIDHAPRNIIELFDRAADGFFTKLPTYTGKEFSLQDWEEVYRDCEASTDVAGMFAPQMIRCYPDAKVILVIRPFDKWYESMNDGVFNIMLGPVANFVSAVVDPVFRSRFLVVGRKLVLGLLEARNLQEARENARSVYDRHHALIKRMKPASELLIFDLNDGWEPLCRFLGKPVPSVAFPRVNERAAIKAKMVEIIRNDVVYAVRKSIPWLLAATVVIVAYYIYYYC